MGEGGGYCHTVDVVVRAVRKGRRLRRLVLYSSFLSACLFTFCQMRNITFLQKWELPTFCWLSVCTDYLPKKLKIFGYTSKRFVIIKIPTHPKLHRLSRHCRRWGTWPTGQWPQWPWGRNSRSRAQHRRCAWIPTHHKNYKGQFSIGCWSSQWTAENLGLDIIQPETEQNSLLKVLLIHVLWKKIRFLVCEVQFDLAQ